MIQYKITAIDYCQNMVFTGLLSEKRAEVICRRIHDDDDPCRNIGEFYGTLFRYVKEFRMDRFVDVCEALVEHRLHKVIGQPCPCMLETKIAQHHQIGQVVMLAPGEEPADYFEGWVFPE